MVCTVRRSNPGWGESFRVVHTGPETNPASFTICTCSFPGTKRPEPAFDHLPPPSAVLRMCLAVLPQPANPLHSPRVCKGLSRLFLAFANHKSLSTLLSSPVLLVPKHLLQHPILKNEVKIIRVVFSRKSLLVCERDCAKIMFCKCIVGKHELQICLLIQLCKFSSNFRESCGWIHKVIYKSLIVFPLSNKNLFPLGSEY